MQARPAPAKAYPGPDPGAGGWQGKETSLRLVGWSRQRRIILLRRKLGRDLAIADRTRTAQLRLSFTEVGADLDVWEYAALVTSLDNEILTMGQLYRDRADCENTFDELKNQWGWGGFTTHDHRVKPGAGSEALPVARWHGGADLQWVQPVRPSGRSGASSRGNHQPAVVAVGDRTPYPTWRPDDTDDQQSPRHARQGTPRLYPHRPVPG
jgi:hypothetical protein